MTRSNANPKRNMRICLLLAVCVLGACALPAAASASSTLDHFALDSYFAGRKKTTPPAISGIKLTGGFYVVTVQGTFSYYGALNYAVPQPPWTIVCGTPEAAPQFGSAGGSGNVGFDAEFIFARPWLPEPCASAKLPVKWTNFQMSTGSNIWAHPTALDASALPNPSHSYEYALVGRAKHHVAFRLYDINTRDNYGSLRISIRAATTADCAGGKYLAFGVATEAECLAGLI